MGSPDTLLIQKLYATFNVMLMHVKTAEVYDQCCKIFQTLYVKRTFIRISKRGILR
jgi:hypothetical protein